ncbi:MAG: LLM class flavin-dependent oxidoreductase, partial [Mycobacterium sp.]
MKLGLYGINTGPCSEPDVAARVAKAAEAAGFDSVWTAEHVVLPDPQAPPSPAPPHMKLLDPAVSLAFLAAHTTKLLLATGI